jgi:5'-3' exonuclease
MGIPGLFKNCIQKYNNMFENNIIQTYIRDTIERLEDESSSDELIINHLFLDFNCAIYYALTSEMKTDDTLIIYTLAYLDTLCKLIPNLKLIYIALDGVPPRAKMEQQRARRFHSVCKKKKATAINDKYGNPLDKTNYNFDLDTNMITPGTEFMTKLSQAIRDHISTSDFYSDKKVIFSDAYMPGEGEHKLLKYIKENPADDNTNTIIYGLDGDLIMLSLVSREKNLYLLREAAQYGGFAKEHEGHKYLFLNIDNLKNALMEEFQLKMAFDIDKTNTDKYIDDYIFLCFILGNDFVPKIHWYSLHEGGHEKLLSTYFTIHNFSEEFLVDRDSKYINRMMLMDIFKELAYTEEGSMRKFMKNRARQKPPVKDEMSERERQQILIDFYPLQYLDIEKNIDPFSSGWNSRYYNVCFRFNRTKANLEMVTDAYIKTLVWNFYYYFIECEDWDYYYPFHYSPTTNDICDALNGIKESNLCKHYKFSNSKPIDPQTLLMMVLPLNSSNCMAKDIDNKLNTKGNKMEIYFPKKYTLNVAFHRYYYECSANIEKFDSSKAKQFMKNVKLTEDEKERNKESKLFTHNI